MESSVDLSISHGNAGIVSFLCYCLEAGIEPGLTRRLLTASICFLESNTIPEAEYIGSVPQSGFIVQDAPAWCRGSIAVHASLLKGYMALQDAERAASMTRRLAAAPCLVSAVDENYDAIFCHGAAGTTQIYNWLWRCTGQTIFAETSEVWHQKILDLGSRKEGPAGYLTFDRDSRNKDEQWCPSLGLLNGLSGIGLALSSTCRHLNSWERVFML